MASAESSAKWVFDGWYENGRYLSNSSSVPISVSSPVFLEARWNPDYSAPVVIIIVVTIALGAYAFLVLIKRYLGDKTADS